jgi:hypothetical protein
MPTQTKVVEFLERLANVASSVQRKLSGLVLVDTIGNVTPLANSLFAIFAFIMMTIMIIFIVISPIILLF